MADMRKLEELIHKEIDKEVAKGSLTPESMKAIGYGIDVIKDLREIDKCEMEMEEGYSGHYPQRGYNITPYYSYEDDGSSYARRRDSMGRYSRDTMDNRHGYSRDDKTSKIDQLQRMMDEAKDPEERETFRRLIVREENSQR